MLAPTPCIEKDCPQKSVRGGRCTSHQRPWADSTRKSRLPSDWSTRRLIVLKRDRGICYLCGAEGADTVDHVEPGDNHNLNNLAAVHDHAPPHCHRYKSSQEGHSAKEANRPRQRVRPIRDTD